MNNEQKAKWLKDQIKKRYDLLKDVDAKKLTGINIPKSLNKLREWENMEFGIEPIRSPSSFTTTHYEHGATVQKIKRILSELKPKEQKKKKKTLATVEKKNREFEELLQSAANQFVQYSHQLKRLEEENILLKSTESGMDEELTEKIDLINALKDENLALRKKIAYYKGKSTSKVTRIDFSGGKSSDAD